MLPVFHRVGQIEPEDGCFDEGELAHYREVLDACHDKLKFATMNLKKLTLWLCLRLYPSQLFCPPSLN